MATRKTRGNPLHLALGQGRGWQQGKGSSGGEKDKRGLCLAFGAREGVAVTHGLCVWDLKLVSTKTLIRSV
jgi:hypothetical protein